MQSPTTSDRRLSESDSERSTAAIARAKLADEEEDEVNHKHYLCFSTSIRSNGSRKCRCRCNLMLTFAIVCGISVILACILIWWIGYRSTSITVDELTSMLRASTLRDVLFKVNDAMAQPLRCSHALRYMYNSRFPDFGQRLTITNETGWLADFTFINLVFPSIIRMGITNTHNLQTAIYRPASSTQRVLTASSGELVIEIAEPANYSAPTVSFNQFIATPIRNVSYNPPTNMNGEIFRTDSADDIRRFTGDTPKTAIHNYNPRGRPFYLAAQELLSMGLQGGWSDPFFSIPTATSPGFVALAAVSVHPDPVTGDLDFLSWSLISTADLHGIFASLELGEHGRSYLIRPRGRCAASSSVEITDAISQNQQDLSMQDGSVDPLLPTIYSLMLEWRLVTDQPITLRNASQFIDTTPVLHSRSIQFDGSTYTVEAQLLDSDVTALPYSIVIVTRDSDWDGNVRGNTIRTIWISAIVCVVAVFGAVLVGRMVTRDLRSVVYYMGRAVRVIEMERSETQRRALASLCEKWSNESNQVMPIIKTSTSPNPPEAQRQRKRKGFTCCRSISRGIHESKLLQRAFGSVLHSLASYDELEVINQAKRQFIRYIFHEVRVPFNAIVLGIESMQMELKTILNAQMSFAALTPIPTPMQLTEHRNQTVLGLESCSDTLGVLREQSDVVSHILNDVLSMQKIEDGALVLEFDAFSIETMIRGALYAFRSACVEKKLKVELEIASVDHFVNSCPLWIPHLGRKKQMNGVSPSPSPNDRLPPLIAASLIKTPSASPFKSDRALPKEKDQPKHRKSSPHGASVGSSSWIDLPGEQPQLQTVEAQDLSFSGLILGKPMTDKLDPNREMVHHAEIRADNYRLRQCVANFISNAIKFTPLNGQITVKLQLSDFVPAEGPANNDAHTIDVIPGGDSNALPLVDLASTSSASPKPAEHSEDSPVDTILGTINIRVSVKDTGVGISEENAKSLFQQYMQINANKNQQGAGSGLGLNISKSIIELHGGRIGVNTSPGLGSEFWFELPTQVVLVEGDISSTFSTSMSDLERSVVNFQNSLQIQGLHLQNSDGTNNKTLEKRYSSLSPLAHIPSPLTTTSTTNGLAIPPDELSLPRAAIPSEDPNLLSANASTNPSSRNSVRNSLPRVPIIRVTNLIESAQAGESSGTYTPPPALEFDESINSIRRMRRPSQLGLGIGLSPTKDGSLYDNPPLGTPPVNNGTSILQLPHVSNNASASPRNNSLPSLRNNSSYAGATSSLTLHAPAQDLSALPRLSASTASSLSNTPVSSMREPPAALKDRRSFSNNNVLSPVVVDNNGTLSPLPPITGSSSGSHPNLVNATPEAAPMQTPGLNAQVAAPSSHHSSPARRSFSLAMDPFARPATPSETPLSAGSTPITPSSSVSPMTPLGPKGVRVLVVEDSKPNRKLLMSLLSHMKCVAEGVENGQECVDLFPPHVSPNQPLPFDIVIMDGSMPVMNGVEATQLLRARGVQIPILALTGNALAEDIEAFMQAGCTTVLTKPINRAQLQKAIHTHSKHLVNNK